MVSDLEHTIRKLIIDKPHTPALKLSKKLTTADKNQVNACVREFSKMKTINELNDTMT